MFPAIGKYTLHVFSISLALQVFQTPVAAQVGSDLDSLVTTILIVGVPNNSQPGGLVLSHPLLQVGVEGIPGHIMDVAKQITTETNTWVMTLHAAIRLRDIRVTPILHGYTWEQTDVRYEGNKIGRFLFQFEAEKLWQVAISSDPPRIKIDSKGFAPKASESTNCKTSLIKRDETFSGTIHVDDHYSYHFDFNFIDKGWVDHPVIEHDKGEIVDRVLEQIQNSNLYLKLLLNHKIKTKSIKFELVEP